MRDDISVTAPTVVSWRQMVRVLFRPFSLERWLALGFTAWLATLLDGGFGTSFQREFVEPHSHQRDQRGGVASQPLRCALPMARRLSW